MLVAIFKDGEAQATGCTLDEAALMTGVDASLLAESIITLGSFDNGSWEVFATDEDGTVI